MPPELIAGRYRVEREVGRGGMGSVWLCQDERLGRWVAAKQVGGLPGESNLHLARALREARHSAALSHPNVVAIYDALEEDDHVWLVMEYVPSRTLDEIVRNDGPLPPAEAARIGADVADGLAAAHASGTIHRDVKPSNILVRETDGRALIADFGIARTVGQEQLTRSGLVTGTPAYFAPELARGEEPSPAADVWALGVSLYVAVEGRPPYAEQVNAIALLNTIANEPPPQPTAAGPLASTMQRMLDPDPVTRMSMSQAAEELREVAAPQPAPLPVVADAVPTPDRDGSPAELATTALGPPDTVPTRVAPAPRRRGWTALLASAALALLVLAAAGGWWLTRDTPDDTSSERAGAAATGEPSPKPSTKPSPKPSTKPSPKPATSPSASPSESSPAAESATPSGSVTPANVRPGSPGELVADYYGLLPGDTGAAWQLLSPDLQNRIGQDTYEGFWATIDEVSVDDVDEVGDGVVQVTVTYTTDGRSEQETRQLRVEPAGGGLLITDDDGPV